MYVSLHSGITLTETHFSELQRPQDLPYPPHTLGALIMGYSEGCLHREMVNATLHFLFFFFFLLAVVLE